MIQRPEIIRECRELAPALSGLLAALGASARAGVSPRELDGRAALALRAAGLTPVLKGYNGFPAHASIGVNDDVLNTAPSSRPIAPGDLVKIALDAKGGAAYVSQAATFCVPPVAGPDRELARAGAAALERAVAAARPGARVGDVGAAIQSAVEGAGFSVVRDYVGCGIGEALITSPPVPGFGAPGRGLRLRAGVVLNLHVIANAGAAPVRVDADGWNARAADGSKSVLFTAMVHVGERDAALLTPFVHGATW
jgi:methionyl aminopeptidase